MLTYIVPFIVLILIVVSIHEYGHYYFAKKYGVGVTDFSIGFGKEIFGWNDKSGTRWKICWIPLGGYVKFFGDRNVYSQADHDEIIKKYSKEEQEKMMEQQRLEYNRRTAQKQQRLVHWCNAYDQGNYLNIHSEEYKRKTEKINKTRSYY